MSKWKLVNDPSEDPRLTLCHYEEIPDSCCEFKGEERECPECSIIEEEQVKWHAAPYCPFCRGVGIPVTK